MISHLPQTEAVITIAATLQQIAYPTRSIMYTDMKLKITKLTKNKDAHVFTIEALTPYIKLMVVEQVTKVVII